MMFHSTTGQREWFALALLLGALLVASTLVGASQGPLPPARQSTRDDPPARKEATTVRGVEIVQVGGYPELHVDGKPFFIHSAAFFYYRIPRDLWSRSLDRHRDLGINTIDLYIPWNWHEPREGEFDFDGHTNSRRDLRGLLQLISQKGFKLIVRPGPVILNEWRHGGYPEWLLVRPEYKMEPRDILEGRYAPLSNLNPRDAEAAAKGWLDNSTHMNFARKWLAAVARELDAYGPRKTLKVKVPAHKRGELTEKEISGPLLFVQLDDDMALGRTNNAGPFFWRYMEELRNALEAGGLGVQTFINPIDMRVTASGAGLERPIGVMGQWYLQPPEKGTGTPPEERKITARDASTIEFYVEELKTQPAFPPAVIEYQAAWYAPGDDARPRGSSVANTLLSSRLLLAHGLHGVNYFPLQDSITPPEFSTPWTNRYYRWDAALDVNASRQPRSRAIVRNGLAVDAFGTFLAASHKRADFGLVYPLGAYSQESLGREDVLRVSQTIERILRIAQLDFLSAELLDPQYQPAEQLLRQALVLLPVVEPANSKFLLSEKAQRALVEYVRRGGTLIFFPERPEGAIIEELWAKGIPIPPERFANDQAAAVSAGWTFGQGRVLQSGKDFYSWVSLEDSFSANRAKFESAWALKILRDFVALAGVRPAVKVATPTEKAKASESAELVVTQLIANPGTDLLGARRSGGGLLSVTNLNYESSAELSLELLSTRASARPADKPAREEETLKLALNVPAHESLLLPIQFPLCHDLKPGEPCDDEIISSGAELVWAEHSGKTLELTLYTPARATISLRLARQPGRVQLDDNKTEARWYPEDRRLEVDVLRGASPDFLRVVKINLPYVPHVPEKPDPAHQPKREFEFSVADALRLPLAENVALPSDPPLVVLDSNGEGKFLAQGANYDELGREIDVSVEGPVRGSGYISLDGNDTRQVPITVKAQHQPGAADAQSRSADAAGNGVLRSELLVRSGHDRRPSAIEFVSIPESGVAHYQYDFERDGQKDWVLENSDLRLIVSPEGGGQAVAFVQKSSGMNLTTNVGALRDTFVYTPNPGGGRAERAHGRYGMFNRPYAAEWVAEEKNTALRLSYSPPDIYPNGARITKTVRLTGLDALEADYEVSLNPPGDSAPPASAAPAQAFVAVNSVPVDFGGDRTTQFCWMTPAALASQQKDATPPEHCEAFAPDGSALEVPAGVQRLEVRTPGRVTLALEWPAGEMCVEMKHYSALLKLQFAPLVAGGEPGKYRVRFVVLPAP